MDLTTFIALLAAIAEEAERWLNALTSGAFVESASAVAKPSRAEGGGCPCYCDAIRQNPPNRNRQRAAHELQPAHLQGGRRGKPRHYASVPRLMEERLKDAGYENFAGDRVLQEMFERKLTAPRAPDAPSMVVRARARVGAGGATLLCNRHPGGRQERPSDLNSRLFERPPQRPAALSSGGHANRYRQAHAAQCRDCGRQVRRLLQIYGRGFGNGWLIADFGKDQLSVFLQAIPIPPPTASIGTNAGPAPQSTESSALATRERVAGWGGPHARTSQRQPGKRHCESGAEQRHQDHGSEDPRRNDSGIKEDGQDD